MINKNHVERHDFYLFSIESIGSIFDSRIAGIKDAIIPIIQDETIMNVIVKILTLSIDVPAISLKTLSTPGIKTNNISIAITAEIVVKINDCSK